MSHKDNEGSGMLAIVRSNLATAWTILTVVVTSGITIGVTVSRVGDLTGAVEALSSSDRSQDTRLAQIEQRIIDPERLAKLEQRVAPLDTLGDRIASVGRALIKFETQIGEVERNRARTDQNRTALEAVRLSVELVKLGVQDAQGDIKLLWERLTRKRRR